MLVPGIHALTIKLEMYLFVRRLGKFMVGSLIYGNVTVFSHDIFLKLCFKSFGLQLSL